MPFALPTALAVVRSPFRRGPGRAARALGTALAYAWLLSCSVVEPPPARPAVDGQREAWWVYTDEISAPARQDRLLAAAQAAGVNTLYVSVYRPEPNEDGWRLYPGAPLSRLLGRARQAGIEVWAAYGNEDWADLGCRPGAFPHDRLQEVLAYNRRHPQAAFTGVMLDIEPVDDTRLDALVGFYRDALDLVAPSDLRLATAIRFYWDYPVGAETLPTPAYAAVVGLDLDHIVVKSYRNYAGRACDTDGVICLVQDELAAAEARRKPGHIVVGLRTTSLAADGGHEKETFHGLPDQNLHDVRRDVLTRLGGSPAFGGFATYQYQP